MNKSFLYTFNYDSNQRELVKMESRHIFDKEEKDKILFSNIKIEPSSSAFIKRRLDIILYNENYDTLIHDIKKENIRVEGFKVEYFVLNGDKTEYADRLDKLKDIGYSIEGIPDYYNPTITYALCKFQDVWYFGVLTKNDFAWEKHKQKPHSFCNSISLNVAKALINIASKVDKKKRLIDTCCGVGTIMLEACFEGYSIEGCEINWKLCAQARENLAHFNYKAEVYRSDIKDVNKKYDAAIIDLPYNLFSYADDTILLNIIKSAAKITDRVVIASTTDITHLINESGLNVSDHSIIQKRKKANFSRQIWLCEKL